MRVTEKLMKIGSTDFHLSHRPFLLAESSLNLRVLLLHLSHVFCANLAPERPVLDPSLLGPLVKSHGQLSSVHVEHVIKAVAHSSARLRLCGRTVGLVAQTVFRQNLSLREDLEGVFFNFRLFAKGLATLDRAVRSHTHHIIKKHAPNLTQDLASQPLLPLTPKRRGLWPSKKRPPYATMAGIPPKKKWNVGVYITPTLWGLDWSPSHNHFWNDCGVVWPTHPLNSFFQHRLPIPWNHFSNHWPPLRNHFPRLGWCVYVEVSRAQHPASKPELEACGSGKSNSISKPMAFKKQATRDTTLTLRALFQVMFDNVPNRRERKSVGIYVEIAKTKLLNASMMLSGTSLTLPRFLHYQYKISQSLWRWCRYIQTIYSIVALSRVFCLFAYKAYAPKLSTSAKDT